LLIVDCCSVFGELEKMNHALKPKMKRIIAAAA
jgi:hypothetical protein